MDWGVIIFGLILMGGPALWIVSDSSKRYGKTSWILAALVAPTLWASLVVYALKRFFQKPGGVPLKPTPFHWLAAVVPSLLIFGLSQTSHPANPGTAAAPPPAVTTAKSVPADAYREALALGAAKNFDGALGKLRSIPKTGKDTDKVKAKIREYEKLLDAKLKAEDLANTKKRQDEEKADAVLHPANYLKIVSQSWHKGGFGSVALFDVTIQNNSAVTVGDIQLVARFNGESGTEVGSRFLNSKTLNVILKPHQTRTFSEVNFGLVSDQASGGGVEIRGAKSF